MKTKILLTALMVTLLSLTVSTTSNAHPFHYRGGWGRPHAAIFVPRIPIPVPRVVVNTGYYGGGYYAPNYNRCYGNRYDDRAYYGRSNYGRGYRGECRGEYRGRDCDRGRGRYGYGHGCRR